MSLREVGITIEEGGTPKTLHVEKLETKAATPNAPNVLWVPESSVHITSLEVTENGEYDAMTGDAGLLYLFAGFNPVVVNVPGGAGGEPGGEGSSIIGKDPADGEEYVYTVDENGEIEKTLMPSGILITTPPTKLDYADGETIDFSGIVVKLRKGDGTIFTNEDYPDGVIPFAELSFPVTVAHASSQSPSATSDLFTGNFSQPIPIFSQAWVKYTQSNVPIAQETIYTPDEAGIMMTHKFETDVLIFAGSSLEAGYTLTQKTTENGVTTTTITHTTPSLSYTHNGKTVYYTQLSAGRPSPASVVNPQVSPPIVDGYGDDQHRAEAAWTVVYGEITGGGVQDVPVQWTPPADKFPAQKTRSTTFEITVTESNSAGGGTSVDDEGFSGNEGGF